MFLFAEDANYANLIGNLGIVGAIIWVVVMYGPKLIAKHVEFIDATREQGSRSVTALETLAASGSDVQSATQKTNVALLHATDAVEVLVKDHPKESELMPHLNLIREKLKK